MSRFIVIPVVVAICVHTNASATPSLAWIDRDLAVAGESACQFKDDERTLSIRDGEKEIAWHTFCSSYGNASARLVQAMSNESYLLLEYGEGRGPNAVARYLGVYRLSNELLELARTPLSWASTATTRWSYKYSVDTPTDGGIVIRLELEGPMHLPGTVDRPERLRVITLKSDS